MSFTRKKARDLERGDRVFIGINQGGAIVERVFGVGDAAIPDRVYVLWQDGYDRKRVIPTWSGDEIFAVYPSQTNNY